MEDQKENIKKFLRIHFTQFFLLRYKKIPKNLPKIFTEMIVKRKYYDFLKKFSIFSTSQA